jgi:hypothetical protein
VSPEDTDAPATPTPVAARARRVILFAVVAVVVLALDVVSKVLVVAHLPETHQPVRVLGGAIYLNQTRNSGAAFSLGTGFTIILTAVALAVVVVIVRTAGRMRSTGWALALGLVLGGAPVPGARCRPGSRRRLDQRLRPARLTLADLQPGRLGHRVRCHPGRRAGPRRRRPRRPQTSSLT